MSKVVTLGEIMMRLSPPSNKKLIQADAFDVHYGGGEANVAAALSNYGHNTDFVTVLPDNTIGDCVISFLRKMNVSTNNIIRREGRLGIYFLEIGSSVRPSSVVYDRSESAFSRAKVSDFDFDTIFKGADLFHICGITPALSENCSKIALTALKAAKANGVKTSLDVNFRRKLWDTQTASKVLSKLVEYADICFANAWDAHNLLGVTVDENAAFFEAAKAISAKYGTEYVIATQRINHSASNNDIIGYAYSKNTQQSITSRTYSISPIIDRVGTGDSFAAGVLCGILDNKPLKSSLEFGVASAALAHTIPGDFKYLSKTEIEQLANGDIYGKVQR